MTYKHIKLPESGSKISVQNGKLSVPDNPILGYVEGDGIGPDITAASLRVWDAAVEKAYAGKRKVHWCELYMGEKAAGIYEGDYFPEETLAAIRVWSPFGSSWYWNHRGLFLAEILVAAIRHWKSFFWTHWYRHLGVHLVVVNFPSRMSKIWIVSVRFLFEWGDPRV